VACSSVADSILQFQLERGGDGTKLLENCYVFTVGIVGPTPA
jgi:hypothetical protein